MKVTTITEYEPGDGVTCRVDVTNAPNNEKRVTIDIAVPRQTVIVHLNRTQCSQLAGLLEAP